MRPSVLRFQMCISTWFQALPRISAFLFLQADSLAHCQDLGLQLSRMCPCLRSLRLQSWHHLARSRRTLFPGTDARTNWPFGYKGLRKRHICWYFPFAPTTFGPLHSIALLARKQCFHASLSLVVSDEILRCMSLFSVYITKLRTRNHDA